MSAAIDDPSFLPTVPKEFAQFGAFADAIRWRAEQHAEELAFTFLDGEMQEQNLTFGELDCRARVVAKRLLDVGEKGTRALMIYESGLDYIVALIGCFYAGVICVPVYPPNPLLVNRTLDRLERILEDSEARIILSTGNYARYTESLRRTHHLQHVLATDQFDYTGDEPYQDVGLSRDSTALLQYTSGSTGIPKGVMITQDNLFYNMTHIQNFDQPQAVIVSWLPMYHDMGLMGMVLQTLHSGRRLVFMSPLSFVQRPFRWLQAISRYRAFATSSPNFGYDLCVRKISAEEIALLDLSCWTLACNGAEPVRAATLDRFSEHFAACGFKREAFYPCYGLAEATLIVSGGEKYSLPVVRRFDARELTRNRVKQVNGHHTDARTLVGCGRPVMGTTVRIVDPDTGHSCPPRTVGEIWVKGPGVARGYWKRATLSRANFGAYLPQSGDGPFLRTGDLGFLHDEELFIAGRKKDLIIARGRNHYPQDIERTVEGCHPGIRTDSGAAFQIDDGREERLVLVQEIRRPRRINLGELIEDIRSAVVREHELVPYAIVLVKGGAIAKTSSGKLQRLECKNRYLNGELAIVAHWCANQKDTPQVMIRPEPAAEAKMPPPKLGQLCLTLGHANRARDHNEIVDDLTTILKRVCEATQGRRIGPTTRLFADLELTSIDLIMLQGEIDKFYERDFPFHDFLADLGRRQVRDVTVQDYAEFLCENFARCIQRGDAPPAVHVAARGLRFYCRQCGQGPDVILIHGITGNMAVWYLCGLVQSLSRQFRVTTYDLRGHGYSDEPENGYTSHEMAEDLFALQQVLGLDRPYLLGHSFGAAIALQAAVLHPRNVSGVILSDAYLPGLADVQGNPGLWPGWEAYRAAAAYAGIHLTNDWDNLGDLFRQAARLTGQERENFIEIAGEATLQRLVRLAATTCGTDVGKVAGLDRAQILNVEHPVVCLYGEHSPFKPLGQFLAEQLVRGRLSLVSNAEHFAFEENPDAFVRLSIESLCSMAGMEPSVRVPDGSTAPKRQETMMKG